MTEEENIKNKRGKWSQEGIPHKGWSCVDIEDTLSNDTICEMCESQQIRYVHYMHHQDYTETLAVGCICAGNMEENLLVAKKRENHMKSRANKRKRWLTRKWKMSEKGNDYINAYGFNIVVFKKNNEWKFRIALKNDVSDELTQFIRKPYKTKDEAMLASFDYVTKKLSEK